MFLKEVITRLDMELGGRERLLAKVFDATNRPLKLLMGGYVLDGVPQGTVSVLSRLEEIAKRHAIQLPAFSCTLSRPTHDLENRLVQSFGTLLPFLEEDPRQNGWALNQVGMLVLRPVAAFLAFTHTKSVKVDEFFGLAKDFGPYVAYRMLGYIVAVEATQKSDLIRLLDVAPSVVGNRLNRLEHLGMIEYHTRSRDGKIKFSLTDRGRKGVPDFSRYRHPLLHEKVYRLLYDAQLLTHDEVAERLKHSNANRAIQTLRSLELGGIVASDNVYRGGKKMTHINPREPGIRFFGDCLKVIADFVLYDDCTHEYRCAYEHIYGHPLWKKNFPKLFSSS